MPQQRLHSALAPIDVLTRIEMEEVLHKGLDNAVRARYIGVDAVRFPDVVVTATGTTTFLGTGGTMDPPIGPAEGDIWMVRRIIVKSSVLTDAAKYVLYRGSTPSDIANAYGPRNLLEGFAPGSTAAVVPSPAIGASPSTYVNTNNTPVNVTINGGTVTSIAVNGQTITGATSGTFTLQPGGYITVTYTVVPTTYTITNAASSVSAGLNVNIGFYPANRSLFVFPGEQIYAQVLSSTVGNQYYIDGEAIRVPAEMKGKVLT